MTITNVTPNAYTLKHKGRSIRVNPWQRMEIPEDFRKDVTYRLAVDAGDLREEKEDAKPAAEITEPKAVAKAAKSRKK